MPFKKLFLFILLLTLKLHGSAINYYNYGPMQASYNSFGEIGLIQIPTAETSNAGNISFTGSRNNIYKFGSLAINPFDWLEASYFYYRPYDLWWSNLISSRGRYLDKGFSVKFTKNFDDNLTLAIGLSDFAGTGFFSREYFLATYKINQFKLTGGIGWGSFADRPKASNPFKYLFNDFNIRSSARNIKIEGGNLNTNQWFKGDISFLFGMEYFLPSRYKTSIMFEIDPFDYYQGFSALDQLGRDYNLRKSDNHFNFGINHRLSNNFSLKASYIKGNTFNLTFSMAANFSKPFFKKKILNYPIISSDKGASKKEIFFEDLLLNLKRKEIFVQSSKISDSNLEVAISTSKFRDPILTHAILGEISVNLDNEIRLGIKSVTSIPVNVGTELARITTPIDLFQDRKEAIIELVSEYSSVDRGHNQNYRTFEFRPTIKYPASFTGIVPALVNHIGDPAKFYYGGIVMRLDNEIQFSSRLQLNTEIHQNLTNNFDDKRNFPDSKLPRVRTDVVSYLQESDSYISRMQLDYFFHPYREIFGKFSIGILENMYAGAGVEFLFKPFDQNFSIGLEAYRAKKRAFNRKFDFLDYEINTGHVNFNYHLPDWGILGTLSYGKYLAGDEGYTFDISRRLSSGFRTGVFFTRTNVSAELFGEGSFDKGFYFQIPIDLFLNDYRGGYINFKLRPLTRDGGQKLEAGNDLIGIMHSTSRAEIERDWESFND